MMCPGGARHSAPPAFGTVIILCIAAAGIAAPSLARAQAWTANSSWSHSSSFNQNPSRADGSSGLEYLAAFGTNVNATMRLPGGAFGLAASVGRTFVHGLDGGPWTQRPNESVSVNFKKGISTLSFGANASFSRTNSYFTEDEEQDAGTGITSGTSNALTTSFGIGLGHAVNALNSVSFSASGSITEFDNDSEGLVGSDRASVSGSWSRKMTRRVSGSISASASCFQPDDAGGSSSYAILTGLSWSPSKHLSLSGSSGVRYTESSAAAAGPSGKSSEIDFPVDFSVLLSHSSDSNGLSFDFTQDVSPSNAGTLITTTRAAVSYSKSIQIDLHKFSWSAGYSVSERTPGDVTSDGAIIGVAGPGVTTVRQTFSFAPSYSYELTKDLDLSAGYRFSMRKAAGEWADVSAFHLSLNYRGDVELSR